MKETDAYEQAYKNGYENGKREAESNIVHCKDCKFYDEKNGYCEKNYDGLVGEIEPNDYCSHGDNGI